MPEAGPAEWDEAQRAWRDESGAVMRAAQAGVEITPPDAPVLVICGAEDASIPAPVCLALADRLGAERRVYPGVSHVGALLGAHAPRIAAGAVRWIENRVQGATEAYRAE
jgi:pimeloyl-ACP methyl ester carboxylesterase